MDTARAWGFTLIELLVVIAIIGILAGLVSVALPLALEKAKIADVQADFRAISTALSQYFTENQSYPPGYGFRRWPPAILGKPDPVPLYNPETYMANIGLFGALDFHDRFSTSYDANNNKRIDMMEYVPYVMATDRFEPLDPEILAGNPPYVTGGVPLAGRLKKEQRPYIYAPYYSKQMDKLKREIAAKYGGFWPADTWDSDFDAEALGYPPPRYDGFVLISVGPTGNTSNVASPPDDATFLASIQALNTDAAYNILALRAAYLGTRDLNENGIPDFDFIGRSRQDEADPATYGGVEALSYLPDGTRGAGPLIYHQAP